MKLDLGLPQGEHVPEIPWSHSRVLIIEDSEAQVQLLKRVLEDEGYECASVMRGDEAFDLAVATSPDVILLDVELPGVDGLTICRQLKEDPRTRLIPVLIITGGGDEHQQLVALEAGADDYLSKPLSIAELRPRVRSAMRLKKFVNELDNAAATLMILGATIEARDPLTQGHCLRLADYGIRLGRRAGVSSADLWAIERGGFLHDLGKIAIPDAVLFKPGPLTPDEFAIVKLHPAAGDRICAPLQTLERVRPIIRQHHELLDGTGYPDGIRGSALSLTSQIVAIVDVYDALINDRPYRRALPSQRALEILDDACRAGKRDRALVDLFVDELDSEASPGHLGRTA